jgi:hypothetical protein
LESLFQTLGYKIRYEKGSFQSGYCIVEDSKVVVVNRFFDTRARMDTLIEILAAVKADTAPLNQTEQSFYNELMAMSAKLI